MPTNRRHMAALVLVCAMALSGCSRVADDWRAAQTADSAEAFQEFMQQHPGSEYAVQAQERIKQLAEERDWQQASTLDTRDAYEQFVAQHADGKWAQEARVRIENFQLAAGTAIAEPLSAPAAAAAAAQPAVRSGYYAQLGAFSTRANAEAEWQRLRQKFPAQLGELNPNYDAGRSQTQTVYRLRVGVASEQHARELCAALKKQSQGCVPIAG
jgi:phage protein D